MIENTVHKEKLDKYFAISTEAYTMALQAPFDEKDKEFRNDILDMVKRYLDDASHFEKQGNWVLAFAALNYAHGWLDCGARLKIFKVFDSRLFTVDEE